MKPITDALLRWRCGEMRASRGGQIAPANANGWRTAIEYPYPFTGSCLLAPAEIRSASVVAPALRCSRNRVRSAPVLVAPS